MKTTFIYSLSDPDTNEVRYIGKANNLKYRLWAHIHEAKHNLRNHHKCNWINTLLKKDKKPIIEIIEEVSIDDWQASEIYWISQFIAWGFNLINKTKGGECGIISENCRKALALSKKRGHSKGTFKHSESTKAIIKEKRALQIITEEHKKNISNSGKGRITSEETKLKISLAHKGMKFSKEHANNISKSKIKKIKEVYETGEIKQWDNAEQISKHYGISISSVRKKVTKINYKSKILKNKFYYEWN
jgi:hypothetical protein